MELYIHIPFCIRKCAYCDFLSGPAEIRTQDRYMEALLKEVSLAGQMHGSDGEQVDTIFIGGGTPSAVNAAWIVALMDRIREVFSVAENAEITMEANPGTLTADKLAQYRQAGINRLSIGLQSTDDGELARLGRIHTYKEFLENYRLAREAGFTNINIDLMSALPGQTEDSYEQTLRRIVALEPEHISAYSLIIEEGTPFGDRYGEEDRDTKGEDAQESSCWRLPSEEEDRRMYHLTKSILAEAGYQRYEISNYAHSGRECRHNVGYWTRVPYLGLGLGAASYYGGQRFTNTREMEEYLQILEWGGEDPWKELHREIQRLTAQDAMEEFMFLGLRLTGGVSAMMFRQQFDHTIEEVYGPVLEKMCNQGLLECIEQPKQDGSAPEEVFWRLTDPGLDVSNYVLAEFLF